MNATSYLFQSPYNSQVQFGRPDPASSSEKQTNKNMSSINQEANTTLKDAKSFQTSQTTEVEPKVQSANELDIYA
jgi:hypothetical protein